MSEQASPALRDFIYLDYERVRSVAAQLGVGGQAEPGAESDRVTRERVFLDVEPAILGRAGSASIGPDFDFAKWSPEAFSDGQFVRVTGTVRLLDYAWLAMALGGLPAVLKKMSKIELAALRNSDEGRRMTKGAIQQKSLENQSAIAKIEEFKMDELSDVVRGLYPGVVRVKVRPRPDDHPQHVLVASAYAECFYDPPAALTQKYGVEVDAGWSVVGQLNVPAQAPPPQPIRVGNQMEDAFEQMALLMNNAFRVASSPAFPALSLTPLAIYRTPR